MSYFLDLGNLRGPTANFSHRVASAIGATVPGYWLHITVPEWAVRVALQNLDETDALLVAIPGADADQYGTVEAPDPGTYPFAVPLAAGQPAEWPLGPQVQYRPAGKRCDTSIQALYTSRHMSLWSPKATVGAHFYSLVFSRFV